MKAQVTSNCDALIIKPPQSEISLALAAHPIQRYVARLMAKLASAGQPTLVAKLTQLTSHVVPYL